MGHNCYVSVVILRQMNLLRPILVRKLALLFIKNREGFVGGLLVGPIANHSLSGPKHEDPRNKPPEHQHRHVITLCNW